MIQEIIKKFAHLIENGHYVVIENDDWCVHKIECKYYLCPDGIDDPALVGVKFENSEVNRFIDAIDAISIYTWKTAINRCDGLIGYNKVFKDNGKVVISHNEIYVATFATPYDLVVFYKSFFRH